MRKRYRDKETSRRDRKRERHRDKDTKRKTRRQTDQDKDEKVPWKRRGNKKDESQ